VLQYPLTRRVLSSNDTTEFIVLVAKELLQSAQTSKHITTASLPTALA
jgi:hypothetical protein